MKTSQLEQLYKALSDGGFTSMTLESGKVRCRMVRRPLPPNEDAAKELEAAPSAQTSSQAPSATPIVSERVGVFSFGKRLPLSLGATVKKGEVLGIIKGISIQDNVVSPRTGTIEKLHVKEGEIVEFGRVLFVLAPESAVANGAKA